MVTRTMVESYLEIGLAICYYVFNCVKKSTHEQWAIVKML